MYVGVLCNVYTYITCIYMCACVCVYYIKINGTRLLRSTAVKRLELASDLVLTSSGRFWGRLLRVAQHPQLPSCHILIKYIAASRV